MERVSIRRGNKSILLIAPHGYKNDDEYTAEITKKIAEDIDCYCVVNNGWQRVENPVNEEEDQANCNNLLHLQEPVVKEEFLDPIIRFKDEIVGNGKLLFTYVIHGMGDKHRVTANDPDLDMVIGWGLGSPSSHSCDKDVKNAFMKNLQLVGVNAYEGKKGGAMSGWTKTNINQLFRKYYPDPRVQSMQVEIVHSMRKNVTKCSSLLGTAIMSSYKNPRSGNDFTWKQY